ncbi:hypothetical protein ACJ77P_06595 [Syntrophus buswellii]
MRSFDEADIPDCTIAPRRSRMFIFFSSFAVAEMFAVLFVFLG